MLAGSYAEGERDFLNVKVFLCRSTMCRVLIAPHLDKNCKQPRSAHSTHTCNTPELSNQTNNSHAPSILYNIQLANLCARVCCTNKVASSAH